MKSAAEFSVCRRYRYALWRQWASGPEVLFVMLNPSTADETADDPTIRRCIGLARSWGFGSLAVGNVFAYRTGSPARLKKTAQPIGAANDAWLRRLQRSASLTIAAWGNHGAYLDRSRIVRATLGAPHTLGLTVRGEPRHPLYLRRDVQPAPWR